MADQPKNLLTSSQDLATVSCLKIVIGMVGKFCSGKGSAVQYLVDKYGFKAVSFSDRIRDEIRSRGLEVTRENLQAVAGDMRTTVGPQVLAQRSWEYIQNQQAKKAVMETIRSTEEVEFCRKIPNFHLVNIKADDKVRFERMKARNRENDPQTWEDFLAAEQRDLHRDGRNMEEAIALADETIVNNGTPDELFHKIDELLKKLGVIYEG